VGAGAADAIWLREELRRGLERISFPHGLIPPGLASTPGSLLAGPAYRDDTSGLLRALAGDSTAWGLITLGKLAAALESA